MQSLLNDLPKPWCNLKVNSINIDSDLNLEVELDDGSIASVNLGDNISPDDLSGAILMVQNSPTEYSLVGNQLDQIRLKSRNGDSESYILVSDGNIQLTSSDGMSLHSIIINHQSITVGANLLLPNITGTTFNSMQSRLVLHNNEVKALPRKSTAYIKVVPASVIAVSGIGDNYEIPLGTQSSMFGIVVQGDQIHFTDIGIFQISINLSVGTNANDTISAFFLNSSEVLVGVSTQQNTSSAISELHTMNMTCLYENTGIGDFIEPFISNLTSTNDIRIEVGSITVIEL